MEDVCRFDPVAWINTPRWQASRLGLSRMVDLLERLGRPQDELRFVHVAGTNGKGSVCAYVASVLQAAGYKVGLFTSPFILCFEERIRVNGENITGEELARAVAAVRPAAAAVEAACGDHPTEFELMAAVAFEHFRAVGCDIVVLEVGLGGRLDATNVIEAPEASVICRIGPRPYRFARGYPGRHRRREGRHREGGSARGELAPGERGHGGHRGRGRRARLRTFRARFR